jgi:hypothetical protein
MPHPTIKVTGDQRDAIYAGVRDHLGALGDVFIALEKQGNVVTAERLGREFSKDFRLLEDIGWHEDDGRDQVELTMPPDDLAALMKRLRSEAKGGLDETIKERESVAGADIIEEHESTMRACDAVLVYLDPQDEDGGR